MIKMKVITAQMAKNLANKMEGQPLITKIMENIMLSAMKGDHTITVRRCGESTDYWDSVQVFFLGLGYEVIEKTYQGATRMEIRW